MSIYYNNVNIRLLKTIVLGLKQQIFSKKQGYYQEKEVIKWLLN